jgi:hypothetical protein
MRNSQKHHRDLIAILIIVFTLVFICGCDLFFPKDPIEGRWDFVVWCGGGPRQPLSQGFNGYSESYEFGDGTYVYSSYDINRIPQFKEVNGIWYLLGSTYTLEENGSYILKYAWFVGNELRINTSGRSDDSYYGYTKH